VYRREASVRRLDTIVVGPCLVAGASQARLTLQPRPAQPDCRPVSSDSSLAQPVSLNLVISDACLMHVYAAKQPSGLKGTAVLDSSLPAFDGSYGWHDHGGRLRDWQCDILVIYPA
jgi:hypothetical protein